MPLLSALAVREQLFNPAGQCSVCQRQVCTNYCRECDEFCTDQHEELCTAATHVGHRGYDCHAPVMGDEMRGHTYEAEHGAYALNTGRRKYFPPELPPFARQQPVDTPPL